MSSTRDASALTFFVAAIVSFAGAVWMAHNVHQVELLRAEGIAVIAQVTGTRVHHTSDGTEVTQSYAYSDKSNSARYTGTFTPG